MRLRVITALEWSGYAQTSALAPQFVVDPLVAAVVEVVVDVDDVGEGVVALRSVLNAFVQTVSDHLRTRERFLCYETDYGPQGTAKRRTPCWVNLGESGSPF